MPIKDMPLSNKQHAVPQNIMDVEFKLIGDLTMRQFAYLFVFGAIAWGAFLFLQGIFKWPAVIVSTLLGLGLAFVPVEDRGLDQWIINFFKAVYSPTQKVWRKDPQVPLAFTYQNLAVLRQELITLAPTSSRRKLEEYLENKSDGVILDKYDLIEQEYVNKVKEAFSKEAVSYASAAPAVSVSVIEPVVEVAPPLPPAPPPAPQPVELAKPVPPAPLVSEKIVQPQPAVQPIIQFVPVTPTVAPSSPPSVRPQPVINQEIVRSKTDFRRSSEAVLSPMTPDRHSGRRFVRLLPEQGEIILPVRGEKVIKTSDQLNIEGDIKEKTEQLQKLISQIKAGEGFSRVKKEVPPAPAPQPPQQQPIQQSPSSGPQVEITPPVVGQKPDINRETQAIIENIKSENVRLAQEIERLKRDLTASQHSEQEKLQKVQTIQKLEQEKSKTAGYYTQIQSKVQELQTKVVEKQKIETPASSTLQALAGKPNIVAGVVKGPDGTIIDGAVIIVKNARNEPKRAIKTNILGQFALTTPLSDGNYFVEVTKSEDINYSFDIISVNAKGDLIPPIEFKGKSS